MGFTIQNYTVFIQIMLCKGLALQETGGKEKNTFQLRLHFHHILV